MSHGDLASKIGFIAELIARSFCEVNAVDSEGNPGELATKYLVFYMLI